MKKQQKRKSALMVGLLALVLMMTGTFAWVSISQRATNILENIVNHGGRVRDDFDGENKDVYAENFGDSDLFVRIKLTEYLEIAGTPVVPGTIKDQKDTWIPNNIEIESVFRDYITWTMGGEKVYMPTFNVNPESLLTDASGIAIDDITGGQTAEGDGSHDYWTAGDKYAANETYLDDNDVEQIRPAEHVAKPTLSPDTTFPTGYITMTDWIAANKPTGNFWVIDTDGWTYWADRLAPGEATSLLLDAITVIQNPEDDWYYAINVIGEFATASDIDTFEGMSEDARELLYTATGIDQYVIKITQPQEEVTKGATHQLTAELLDSGRAVADTEITWEIISTHASGTSIDADGLVTVAEGESNTSLIVRATYEDAEGETAFADVTFRVMSNLYTKVSSRHLAL